MSGAATISGRWGLGTGRSARGCSICRGPTLPGVRLCTQCKAALKRARHATVTELIPPPTQTSARAAVAARERSALALAAPAVRDAKRIRRWNVLAVALGAAAMAAGGHAVWRLARPAALPATTQPVSSVAPQATTPQPAPAVKIEPAPRAIAPRDASAAPPQAAARSPSPAAAVRTSTKKAADAASAAPPFESYFAVAPVPPVPAPAPVVEPQPAPQPAPPPDRWQLMADAIAQCGREGFFAGVVCEQRVRLQYCEGHWGQAAQCPSGIQNDHRR